ncbi:uncharacterized protein [Drosophila takahashii]|uniref:uncharacterized protein isoform X2 n=1 Tax=Drosophila takahashii TaxID=29030 RepID=UPI0038995DE4
MSAPKKQTSTGRRVIVHLRDIALHLKAADNTLCDCVQWNCEELKRNPTTWKRYPLEAASCPRESSENRVPKDMIEHVDACHSARSQIFGCQDAVYNVDHSPFVFPVSFKTFENNLNRMVVFDMIGKGLEDLLMLAANDAYRYQTLQEFFFRFYVQPEKRPTIKIFKEEVPNILFAKLLESARLHEEKATRTNAENATIKALQSHSIITFEVFSENLLNLPEIVEQMRQRDENYVRKNFDQCAFDFYLAFYITPEIRKKYKCELLPSNENMEEQMLAIPGKKMAKELRQSLPQLATPSPALVMPRKRAPKRSAEGSPIPFKVFRRHVSNLENIANQMLLCDEYRGKSKEEAIREYYKGFYSGPEMRQKFPCRFKPCPAKKLHHLLSFPPEEPTSEFAHFRSVSQPQVEPKKSELNAVKPSPISEILDSACKPKNDVDKSTDVITSPNFNNNCVDDNEILYLSSGSDTEYEEEPSPQISPPIFEEMEDIFHTYLPQTPPNLQITEEIEDISQSYVPETPIHLAPNILPHEQVIDLDASQSLDCFAMPKPKENDTNVEILDQMLKEKVIDLDASQSLDCFAMPKPKENDTNVAILDPMLKDQVIDLNASQSLDCFAMPKPKENDTNVAILDPMLKDQVINLNASQSLDCFAMPKPKENDTSVAILDPMLKKPIDWESSSAPELPYNIIKISVIPGKRSAASQDSASKRVKLVNEKQSMDVTDITSPQPEVNITPSQDFAAGDSLLECSQLQRLLDSPSFKVRCIY